MAAAPDMTVRVIDEAAVALFCEEWAGCPID